MASEKRNVVLLTIDALRADHLSCHGYERPTSPTLDRLAEDGLHFQNAYSASTHTREAIPALLTGRYPDVCVDDSYALVGDTVAAPLSDEGYTTGAFHSNPYVSRAYGFGDDFDVFDDDLYLGQHRLVALAQRAFDKLRQRHYAPAETITKRALSFVEESDSPFFLWAHYMDPHGPYDPPDEYAREFFGETTSTKRAQRLYKRAAVSDPDSITDAEREEMRDLYDGEIRYVDAQIEAFLDGLESRGHREETTVIISADHGDAFGEHGYYGHPRQLDDELLHVPLILPDADQERVETPASMLDTVPTILETAEVDAGGYEGTSLLRVAERDDSTRTVFAQVRGMKDDSHLRRYGARSASDAGWIEREISSGEVTAGPTGELDDEIESHSRERVAVAIGGEAAEGVETDAEVERRLEALGYK